LAPDVPDSFQAVNNTLTFSGEKIVNKNKILACALGTAVLYGSASVAVAQDDDSLFEEITVTATKRAQSIYEVPVAVSAFQGDAMAKQGITNLVDIGKFVPNLNVTSFSGGQVSSVNPFIRGIGLQDHLITTDPGVSVYIDGVYLGRQIGQNWNLPNIERLEVLRGPQGTLYGRNSIGGAINIITKAPGSDPGGRVSIEVGSRERLNGDFYVDTDLGDKAAFSISGGFKNRDGIGEFINLPNAGERVGEMHESFARLALRLELRDDFSLTFTADGADGDGGLRPYTTLIDELPNGALYQAGARNADRAPDPYDNATTQADQVRVSHQAWGLAVTAEWEVNDDITTKIIASTRGSEYKTGLDDDSVADNLLTFPEVGDADQTSVEIQVNGDYGTWDFVSGLYYFTEDGGNLQKDYFFLGGPFDYVLNQEVDSIGIFANVGYDISDNLRISGGLRYSEDDKDAEADIAFGLTPASRDWDEVSWDLSASYSLDNGLNVYGSVQSGYQSGQFNPRPFCFGVWPDCFSAPEDNITAVNYEVGIKGQPLERLQMSAAVFYTDYSDLPYQVSTTTGGGFSTVNIIVDQTTTGFEWESTAYFTDNFLFYATLGYIDVDVDEEGGTTPVAPLTPELTWSISPELRFPMSGGGEISLRADYSYRDDMWGEPSDDPGRMTKIPSRDIINFDFSYTSADESWTAGLYGRNATDERYTQALINVGDYILNILSNDASEFGLRFTKDF
jgi:iron complex outermembrane receptor protein